MCSSGNKSRKVVTKKGKQIKVGGKIFASVTKIKNYLKSLLNVTRDSEMVDP